MPTTSRCSKVEQLSDAATELYAAGRPTARGVQRAGGGQLAPSGRWPFIVGGIVALAAGILTFVWPGITVYVVALLLAWYLIIFGVMHLISALAGPKVSYWWTQLLLGVAELILGVWAVRSWQWSLLTLLTLVGV
jgi:uncharacterized membrane protein HdeD (DUF308 family)